MGAAGVSPPRMVRVAPGASNSSLGMNSIAIYMLVSFLRGPVQTWLWVFSGWALAPLGDIGSIIHYTLVLAVFCYMVYWMHKREIFLKVG